MFLVFAYIFYALFTSNAFDIEPSLPYTLKDFLKIEYYIFKHALISGKFLFYNRTKNYY